MWRDDGGIRTFGSSTEYTLPSVPIRAATDQHGALAVTSRINRESACHGPARTTSRVAHWCALRQMRRRSQHLTLRQQVDFMMLSMSGHAQRASLINIDGSGRGDYLR